MGESLQKTDYLHDLFRYIETHISADLDVALLTSVGFVSRDKLYHDFYSASGHSVKEYVRKRRLSNALALIKTSDLSLTDIAFQCGYSSYLTLWRAVRQTLGLTPSEYKDGGIYYFFPPFSGTSLQPVTVSGDTIPETLCLSFYHVRLTAIENVAVSAFLRVFPDYRGRVFGRNGIQDGSRFCYKLHVTDSDEDFGKLASHGFEIGARKPPSTAVYATSTVRNDEEQINAAWNYLYSDWLHNSMFEYTGEPYYEEYILKNGKPGKLKLHLPIRERGEEIKITLIPNPGLRFLAAKAKGYDAEEIAARAVMGHLAAHHPQLIGTSKEVFMRKEMNVCTCGIKVDPGLRAVENETITSVMTDQTHYLVLESSVTGDYDRYAELLSAFARDNGMDAGKSGLFAVYDGSENFANPKIRMYCPVKIHTK